MMCPWLPGPIYIADGHSNRFFKCRKIGSEVYIPRKAKLYDHSCLVDVRRGKKTCEEEDGGKESPKGRVR